MKRQNFILSFIKNETETIKRSYTTSEMALKDSRLLMHQLTKDGDKFTYNITQQGHTTPITEVYGHNENGKVYYHLLDGNKKPKAEFDLNCIKGNTSFTETKAYDPNH